MNCLKLHSVPFVLNIRELGLELKDPTLKHHDREYVATNMAHPLRAGAAKRNVTKLEAKTSAFDSLDGYQHVDAVSPESTACPVFAKALVLQGGCAAGTGGQPQTVAFVTLDVVAIGSIGHIPDDFLPCLRARAETELGVTSLVVTASHCHGVPCDDVLARTFEALEEACASLEAVQVGAGCGKEDGVSENRRMKLRSGGEADVRQAYAYCPDEDVAGIGAIDPDIGLLRINRVRDGSVLAVVYNFACHPIQGVPSEANCADLTGYSSGLV